MFNLQYPSQAIQIGIARVVAVKLKKEKSSLRVESFAEIPLEKGSVDTSMIKPNVRNPQAVLFSWVPSGR